MIDLDRAQRDPWYLLKITHGHDPDCAVHPAAWGRLSDTACVGCLLLEPQGEDDHLKQDS